MQKLEVFGSSKLVGKILISGSKNASLPILAATLLSNRKVYLKNLPKVKDIETMIKLLQSMGSKIKFGNKRLIIDNFKQDKKYWDSTYARNRTQARGNLYEKDREIWLNTHYDRIREALKLINVIEDNKL